MQFAPLIVLVSLSMPLWSGPPPNTLTAEEKRGGWTLLFDGTSMKGWVDPRRQNPAGDAWSIEDGCLKAKSKPRITEDLFSVPTFGDFELVFEWRIAAAGNSGVKYRIQDHFFVVYSTPKRKFELEAEKSLATRSGKRLSEGQDYVVGFEYQITDDQTNSDSKSNPKHTAGALYDMQAPSSHAAKPVGEFNQGRIVLRGNRVQHWLNGAQVVDASLDSTESLAAIDGRWGQSPLIRELLVKQPRKRAPISLQNHGDEAWFRGIKIRRLD